MIIGVTASRHGITAAQVQTVAGYLLTFRDRYNVTELHHGDCVEGDVTVASLAEAAGLRTVAHPPTNDRYRAFHASDEVMAPLPYLERDRAIVNTVHALIGLPRSDTEEVRSGTWYTIRRARWRRIGLAVIGPTGTLLESRRPERHG